MILLPLQNFRLVVVSLGYSLRSDSIISYVKQNVFINDDLVAVLLILVSQRVTIPIPGVSSHTSDMDKIKMERRGAPATMVEWMILAYVAGECL